MTGTLSRASVHEAGHVVVAACAPHVVAILEVIIGSEMGGGRTSVGVNETLVRTHPLEEAVIALAGHAAERVILGDADDWGARQDIMVACVQAMHARHRRIPCVWEEPDDPDIWALFWFDGTEEEVLVTLRRCYGKALELVTTHAPLVRHIAGELSVRRVVTYGDLREMLAGHELAF